MPRRDPQTGKFVSGEEYNDIEVVTVGADVGVPAADMMGGTGFQGETFSFEGLLAIDYDEIVDRNESLELIEAHHAVTVYANSTQTADGNVRGKIEVSASPAMVDPTDNGPSANPIGGSDAVVGNSSNDDTIDLLGRPLLATGHSPFSDGPTGVGGGGSEGRDEVVIVDPPASVGEFHPRDELFINGDFVAWNIADAAIHAEVTLQHTYGVRAD